MNALAKCGPYCETSIKLLRSLEAGTELKQETLDNLFLIQHAQMKYLQEEYAALLVEQFFSIFTLYSPCHLTYRGSGRAIPLHALQTTNFHRRNSPRLGRSERWTRRVQGLERPSLISVVKRTQNARDSNGFEGVFQSDTRKNIQVLTDNISEMAYVIHKGGPSPALSKLAMAIWAKVIEFGVSIKCAHIAGVENQESDF